MSKYESPEYSEIEADKVRDLADRLDDVLEGEFVKINIAALSRLLAMNIAEGTETIEDADENIDGLVQYLKEAVRVCWAEARAAELLFPDSEETKH